MVDNEQQPLLPHPVEAEANLESSTTASSGSSDRKAEDAVLPETATTGRRLGWSSAYILVLSRVIGSGIFAMPGTIVQNVGNPALALALWMVGALIAWFALSISLEFGCMLPRSGGHKVYLEYAFPKPRFLASTVVAVHGVLLGFTSANCIVFAKYMLFAFDGEASDLNVKLLAVGLMTAITLIHGCAYRTGVWIQNLLGWLKIGLVVFMVITGLFVVLFRAVSDDVHVVPERPYSNMSNIWDEADFSYNTIATALFKISYSYAGLDNINNVLNEVKDPVRTLKRVPPIALITSCVLYVLINIAYLAVVPLEQVKQSRELIAALFFERLFGSGFGSTFLPVAIALSAAGNVMVVTFSLARVNQEIARQGFLPFSSILASSRPFDSPFGGLIVHYIPSVLVIVIPPSASVYGFIADVEGYSGQFFALAVGVGLLLLRYRKPELLRPFRAWTPGVVIRLAICSLLILAPLFPPSARPGHGNGDLTFFYATYAVVGVSIMLFSFAYWAIWTRWLPRLGSYTFEEETGKLADGTTFTKIVRRSM